MMQSQGQWLQWFGLYAGTIRMNKDGCMRVITSPPLTGELAATGVAPTPPWVQAPTQSQKSRQNSGPTPAPRLVRVARARDTRESKAHVYLKPYTKRGTTHKRHPTCSACPDLL